MIQLKQSLFLIILVLSAQTVLEAAPKGYDHSAWDAFLKKVVNEKGEVDFQAAKEDPALLHQYISQLKTIDAFDFERNWPREEKIALWLNAYHAGLIRVVLENYPIENLSDIKGLWTAKIVAIGARTYSLNAIRSDYLIKAFRDEKIHLALACGSKSCPRFPQEAYTALRVEGQLFMATNRFVNDPEYVQILPDKKRVMLSRIFKWYARDFVLDFGAPPNALTKKTPFEMAVLSFIAHYLQDPAKVDYLESGRYRIKYKKFDWSLNTWYPEALGK